ncbi:MAG TPA: hypothetical protein VFF25_03935 [Clostridia bacterium]|nr:hypothetical protein [Clostridia bacterium]
MEKIKDFFHDFSDIFFAIIIIGIMFAVLTVNLGSWFDDHSGTVSASEPGNTQGVQNNNAINSKPNKNHTGSGHEDDGLKTENDADKIESEQLQNNEDADTYIDKDEQKNITVGETKRIVVPSGTFCTGIAKILKDNKLIEDENDFIRAAESLKLSGRLKSGSFEIPIDATTEDMVKIIAGQKTIAEQ